MKHLAFNTGLLLLMCGLASGADPSAEQVEFFEKSIRPVLVRECYECHSAEAKRVQGNLRLDSRAAVLRGGDSGPAVAPGDAKASLLIAALKHESFKMPPKGKLPDDVIANFVRWIESGATDPRDEKAAPTSAIDIEKGRQFWSFVAPQARPKPQVRDASWPVRELDWFVRAAQEQKGLRPVRAATKEEWLRRVTFDLTGLPPTLEESESFLKNDSPEAFAQVVERLLKSDHFGERWARHWLDIARYTDDLGGTVSPVIAPNAFRYRDWVVRAFNVDMPYDQFVKLQLAGDLIAEPTDDYLTRLGGLGFQGLGQKFSGNAVGMVKKKVADELDDRIDTVTRGLLGLTVSCSRCHDHKFDPIPTRDYYALAAAYNSASWSNEVPLASPAAIRARTEWSQAAVAISGRVTNLKQAEAERVGRAELRKLGVYLLTAWRVRVLSAHKIAVDIPALATKRGIQPVILDRCVKLFEKKNSWSQLTEWQAAADAAADAAAVVAEAAEAKDGDVEPPPPLVAATDKAAAKVLEALQELERLEREKREMKDKPEPLTAEHEATLKLFLQDKNALFKLSNDEALPFFTAEAKQQFAELQREQEQQAKLAPPEPLKVPAVTGGGAPLQINVRGNPDQLGDIVPPGFLQVLGESDVGFRSAKADASAKQPPTFTRLDLANAITDRNNPLTARVYVNRVWHHLFGRGLVNTPSNFGQLGERPSHPELLDTLAVRFMEAGWSTKWLLREIVLSATYRLSNQANTTNEQLDADNVMLWRMTPRRLDFEAWRDATLAVAGKLDRTIGGPPLQPDAKTQLHPEDPSHGRRTLYCFISRFKPNPTLTLFDFPEPNVTSERRNLTMIPQQQLFALNSPFIVAMAKEMAARLQREETTDEARVRRAWRLVYCRLPSDEELTASLEYVRSTEHDWPRFCHAVLSSNEFIFLP